MERPFLARIDCYGGSFKVNQHSDKEMERDDRRICWISEEMPDDVHPNEMDRGQAGPEPKLQQALTKLYCNFTAF